MCFDLNRRKYHISLTYIYIYIYNDEKQQDIFTITIMATLKDCIIHPLVLLNCVDHYNRVAKDTKKRVVGVLLGNITGGTADVFNSYAVPFEEDRKDPNVWYLDHNYLEEMESMFRKVNTKEKIVGFYSTGPKLRK